MLDISTSSVGHATPIFTLTNSKATNNATGVESGINSAIFLNGSTVSGNSTGFSAGSGVILPRFGGHPC